MIGLTEEVLLNEIKGREKWLEMVGEFCGSDENVREITIKSLESKIGRLESEVKELQGDLSVYKKVLEMLKEEQCSTY